ncbi:MAG TPA: hypothetical protein VJ954_09845 [Ignavibacteriaceae bacterium]|nr:hypothetical protein [Ignavibacteriaceae bacterium]
MKKISVIFLISLVLFSCEKVKTDSQLIIENANIPLISRVLIGSEIYTEYSYNSANLVTEEKGKFRYVTHTYDDINQLITSDFYWDTRIASSNSHILEALLNREEWVNPENTAKSISHELEYIINEHKIRKSYIRTENTNSDVVEYLYEGDRIIRATGYYNGSLSGYTVYLYDVNGNIIKETRYNITSEGIAELSTTTEYEYDNMHNPYQSFKRLLTPGIYTNPNNITKETYTLNFDVGPSIDKVQITEYSYEYNDLGYPVKVNGGTEYVYK